MFEIIFRGPLRVGKTHVKDLVRKFLEEEHGYIIREGSDGSLPENVPEETLLILGYGKSVWGRLTSKNSPFKS